MENPIKMDDLGVPLFSETSIFLILFTGQVFVGASNAHLRKKKTTKKNLEDHMGEDPGLWYSNWHHASLVARQLLQEVEALADGSEESGGSEVMRKRPGLESWGSPFLRWWFVTNGYPPEN